MRFVLLFLFLPHLASASMRIEEIMYDAPGTDTKHEWIEVCNTGGAGIDISTWKLEEAGVNHALVSVRGGSSVPTSGCVVIADNADTFLLDYPSFLGILFDSVFSLSNEGEVLVLKNTAGDIVDSITYTNTIGGEGDGQTLHRSGNTFVVRAASPGVASGSTPGATTETNTPIGGSGAPSTSSGISHTDTYKAPVFSLVPYIPQIITARTAFTIYGHVFENGKEMENGFIVWNFGDGTTKTTKGGERVTHTYQFKGSYILTARTYRNTVWMPSDVFFEKQIEVLDPSLSIVTLGGGDMPFIELKNDSAQSLDIGGWVISYEEFSQMFPPDTRIGGKHSVRFSLTKEIFRATLYNPQGVSIATYPTPQEEKKKTIPAPAVFVSKAQPKQVRTDVVLEKAEQDPSPLLASVSSKDAPEQAKAPYGLMGIIVLGAGALFVLRKGKQVVAQDPLQVTHEGETYIIEDILDPLDSKA